MAALAASAQLLAFPRAAIGLRTRLLTALKQHRLPERLIEAFTREACAIAAGDIDEALAEVLAARMRPAPLILAEGARFFLIGPSGAGVSSVAAKIRHQAALRNTSILVEDQSFHPRNMRARTAFGCVSERPDVETIGVVSALADAEDIGEIISAFHLDRLIVTGLDMARRFGALAAALTQGARLAHVTRSPRDDAALESLSADDLAALLLD
jgi:ABC-type transport system involved in cytochrome bd biosynthesis fused ATPase/permease subunit